ncbi:MAG: hypothetical protein M1840_004528 [Geoglossum simile]|nr:MAG: hypothetical protein M1840_004528 [Geoglossum simile]
MSEISAVSEVSNIYFRTPLAAVNDGDRLRVYSLDVFGKIRESQYEGKWTGGTEKNVIAFAKIGSPIAATSRKGFALIRVYYIASDETLRESCYDSDKGWYSGALNNSKFVVNPSSKISASFLATDSVSLRVYAQKPNQTIQEYGYDSSSGKWQEMTNLGPALPGSEIASTSYKTSKLSIRVYFQVTGLDLIEKCYDSAPWYTGAFSVPKAPTCASLAVISFNATSNGISLRVYHSTANNHIREKGWDNSGWYDGGFDVSSISGSTVAAICWDHVKIRVYFQNGTHVTGVTEWMWNGGGWSQGQAAISPA